MKMPWNNTAQGGLQIRSNTLVGLTDAGVRKAESMNMGGDLGDVLSTIHSENGNLMVVSELANRTGIPEERIEELVKTYRAFIQIKQGNYE